MRRALRKYHMRLSGSVFCQHCGVDCLMLVAQLKGVSIDDAQWAEASKPADGEGCSEGELTPNQLNATAAEARRALPKTGFFSSVLTPLACALLGSSLLSHSSPVLL